MITLTIPNIDDDLGRRLHRLAVRNGRSVEDEARQAIVEHLADVAPAGADRHESAWDAVRRLRDTAGGGGDFEPLDRAEWQDRPVDFGP